MLRKKFNHLIPVFLFLIIFVAYFGDLQAIPFHPDEATQIYSSQDFYIWLTDPNALAWEPGTEEAGLLQYRLLDEPLHKYIFGLTRLLAGIPSEEVNQDWNWSDSWEENVLAGALPDTRILVLLRGTSTLFTLGAVILVFFTVRNIAGDKAALGALLLISLNGLVILHGRRAMREGVMMFTMALLLWTLAIAERKPWAAGLATAMAVCSRYLLAPLAPLAFLATIWDPIRAHKTRRVISNTAWFAGSFLILFILLQPVLWKHPVLGAIRMAEARIEFTEAGVDLLSDVSPGLILDSWGKKAGVMLYHSFISPLAYYDVGNYADDLSEEIAAYDLKPWHHLWRGTIQGGIFLGIVLAGFAMTILRAIKKTHRPVKLWKLIAIGTVFQSVFFLAGFQIAAQRYYLPLVLLFPILAVTELLGRPTEAYDQ